MGFETVWQFRELEFLLDTDAPCTLTVATEMPGYDIQVRHSVSIDTTTTTGRRPVNVRLPNHTKGALLLPIITPTGAARLYGGRVYAKPLGDRSGWRWLPLPIRETPEGYVGAPLPIRQTPEGFSGAPLPIRTTPEAWERFPLPIIGTPAVARWIDVPVDSAE